MWELPDVCGSSYLKPEGATSGFSIHPLLASQIVGRSTRDPDSQSQTDLPSGRRETAGGANQRNDMDCSIFVGLDGMKWGMKPTT